MSENLNNCSVTTASEMLSSLNAEEIAKIEDPDLICKAIVSVCQMGDDFERAYEVCERFYSHNNPSVVCFCIFGLLDIFLRFGRIKPYVAYRIFQSCRNHEDRYVRNAVDDFESDLLFKSEEYKEYVSEQQKAKVKMGRPN